jgi:hypothetical protein
VGRLLLRRFLPLTQAILTFPTNRAITGCTDPLGLISLITCEQSSLKCIWKDTDLSEPLEGEEGAAMDFPLSRAWWTFIFNLFLAWEDCTDEWSGASWTMGLIGGGAGKDKLVQPQCWDTTGWTISYHPSFSKTSGCNET